MSPPTDISAPATDRVLLVGNPNVGKSVIFGGLTRRYVVVSNYPGTTVEVARGTADLPTGRVEVLDLPGVNNLIPQSEDECVTRDALLRERPQAILQVADAKNLRRGLLLSLALREMGLPFVLTLNMMDEAASRGVRIDLHALSRELAVPLAATVATRGKGLRRVRKLLGRPAGRGDGPPPVDYGPLIEETVAAIEPLLPDTHWTKRGLALMVLAGDEGIREWCRRELGEEVTEKIRLLRRDLDTRLRNPVAHEISQARLARAGEILSRVYRVDPAVSGIFTRMGRFGESPAGGWASHGATIAGAALILLSLGGFPFAPVAAGVCAALVAVAVAFGERRGLGGLPLLGLFAGAWLAGMALRPISDVLPAEGILRSGWFQGFGGALLIFGITLGRRTTHLVWGTLGACGVLYILYLFVGVFGADTLVGLLEEQFFGRLLGPAAIDAVDALFPFGHVHPVDADLGAITGKYTLVGDGAGGAAHFFHDLLVGPYGAVTMALSYAFALILPVVGTFFLFFGILEDSGYLPRLAVMMNRGFRAMGLNGKAVLPMVLGLGCDTMATLTTRVLDTRKERVIVTLLLALGIPCSAQLGVILGITGSIGTAAVLWWAGTIVVVLFAVGWLSSLIVPGQRSDFILELPPLRVPRLGNILLKTLARIEWYLKEAVPLFFIGTLILFLLDWFGAIEPVQWAAAPIVEGFLDLPRDVTPTFLIGFLRRDYGAAGLSDLWKQGLLTPRQAVVALVTITLFVPCIANFFIMIKERGLKAGSLMVLFILPIAFLVGGLLNFILALTGALS